MHHFVCYIMLLYKWNALPGLVPAMLPTLTTAHACWDPTCKQFCSYCLNCLIVFHCSHCVKYDALHWSLNLSIRSLTVQNQIPLPCNWILRMVFLLFDSLFGRVQVPFFIFIFIFLETPFTFPLSVSKNLIQMQDNF